jgi:hypothetical protein
MNIYFLCGYPRAGNTLFGSLMNQNTNVKVSPNSILPLMLNTILKLKNEQMYQNFKDHIGIDNIVDNIFNNYYAHYNSPNILDRGLWGFPCYYKIIEQIIKKRKFIILYRPFVEVLASFANQDKPENLEDFVNLVVGNQYAHLIMDSHICLNNLVNKNENYLVVHFNKLIKNTNEELKKVCEFLEIDFIAPDYNNIKQFEINNVKYDDSVLMANFHNIRTDKIHQEQISYKEILTKSIIERFKNFDLNLQRKFNYESDL